jgi:hypothetical protein
MISFALARELREAGFSQRTVGNAVYFVNEHLKIRREDALRMWYIDKAKEGWEIDLSKEIAYSPTLTELIEAVGLPFYLSCDTAGRWYAANASAEDGRQSGGTPAEAVARLWLLSQRKI